MSSCSASSTQSRKYNNYSKKRKRNTTFKIEIDLSKQFPRGENAMVKDIKLCSTSRATHPVSKANQASMNKDNLEEEEHGGVGDCFSGEVSRLRGNRGR